MTLPSVQTRDHFCARDSLSKASRLSDILVRCRNVSGSPYPSPLTTLAYTPALPCLSGTTLQPTSAPTAAHSCDIDGITNAVPGGNYSSCDGKRSGELCALKCSEGYAGYDAQGNTVDTTDFPLVCNANGDFQDTSGLVCQPNSCDIDDITNTVANADYSSCHGKTSGEVCAPVCVPGTEQITNASQPIHLVCDADGDFVHDIALTGAVVANVARLNASLSNFTDVQVVTDGSSTGSFVLPTDAVLLKTSNPI